MAGPELELVDVEKLFQSRNSATLALTGINLTVAPQEFVSIIGQSGCGKTTLLRILSGLIRPTSGEVRAEGRSLWSGDTRDRNTISKLGLVFQESNLFPWYSVEDNVALPLKLRGVDRQLRRDRAHELCELVGLSGFEKSYPRELSGGMRQRAAIARALSYRPRILLMDEPFGALDALTREKMNLELLRIWSEARKTILFVTHGISEAVFLGTRVVVLTAGPARMADNFVVDLPHPRTLDMKTHDVFGQYTRRIYRQLGME
jgi:NitT/TauT family transport system ATP-binding protein